jgi:ABC-type amino acid transport system permease subunit
MTNTTKTIGGAFASAVFGVVLVTAAADAVETTVAPLAGYMTVWAICGIGALVAMVLLFFVPKLAFADMEAELLQDAEAVSASE